MSGGRKRDLLKARNADYYADVSKAERRVAKGGVSEVSFGNVKGGSSLGARGNNSLILSVLGCVGCSWCETELCPHSSEVSKVKSHTNKICGERIALGKFLVEDGHKVDYKRLLWLKQAVEADKIGGYLAGKALRDEGGVSLRDVLPWKRLVADAMAAFVKQEEGSKVTMDVRNVVDEMREIIDVTPEEVKTLEKDADNEG